MFRETEAFNCQILCDETQQRLIFNSRGDDRYRGSNIDVDFSSIFSFDQRPFASTKTSPQQTLSITRKVQQDYALLNSSLKSGDLSGAQSAFASLQQALQSQGTQSTTTPPAQSPTNSSADPITNDLIALGSALSSGNLTQAQSAFSPLQNDIQIAQKPRDRRDKA